MSYDIDFRVKVEGVEKYISTPVNTDANITWNVGKIIRESTGLEWKNEENNGLVKDVMQAISKGLEELEIHPERYWQYESPNGWGTVEGTKHFFRWLLEDWGKFQEDWEVEGLADVVTFWIV